MAHLKSELPQIVFGGQSPFKQQCYSLIRGYKAMNPEQLKWSVMVTRMVENSFSMIRQKQEHPTVAEYLRISSMMTVQLVREVSLSTFSPLLPCQKSLGSYSKMRAKPLNWKLLKSTLISSVKNQHATITPAVEQPTPFQLTYLTTIYQTHLLVCKKNSASAK